MAVGGGVGVEGEAHAHRDTSAPGRRRQRQPQRGLQGVALGGLILVFLPRGLDVNEVLSRGAQHPAENRLHLGVVRRGQRHHLALLRPQRLWQQRVEVRRELKAGAKPLGEDDGASTQRAHHTQSPGRFTTTKRMLKGMLSVHWR